MMAAMDTPDLHAALARLHAELNSAPQLDAESRRLLLEIAGDIERLIGRVGDARHSSRLESLAVDFEAGHPALAASLRDIVDLLTRIGA
jgi:hypothetical protein